MRTIAITLSNLGFRLYCSSPAVEEFLNDLPYISAKRIFFPTKDKRKLREVFDEFDIQCVINLAPNRGKSVTDEDYVARRCVPIFDEVFVSFGANGDTLGTLLTLGCHC